MRRRRSGQAGSIRLGMIDAAATHHLGDALWQFREDRPDVQLHLTVAPSGPLLEELRAGSLDLVVCVRPEEAAPSVVVVELLDDPLAVMAPAGSGVDDPTRWGPWVTFPEGSHTRRVIAAHLDAVGARFDVVADSHQPEVLREMVRLGMGWTVLPTAGLGVLDDVDIVRAELTHRTLVLARRRTSGDDAVFTETISVDPVRPRVSTSSARFASCSTAWTPATTSCRRSASRSTTSSHPR